MSTSPASLGERAGRNEFVGMFCDRSYTMLGAIIGVLWTILSADNFAIPLTVIHLLSSGSS